MITDNDCPGIDADRKAVAIGRRLMAHGQSDHVLRLARRILKRRIRTWWRYERRWLEEIGYYETGEAGA